MTPTNEQRPRKGASSRSRSTGQPMSEPIVGGAGPLHQPAGAFNREGIPRTGEGPELAPARLLRSKDAAHYIGVGPRTLWTLTNLGRVQSVRFNTGGRDSVRYDRADLDRFIDEQKTSGRNGGAR